MDRAFFGVCIWASIAYLILKILSAAIYWPAFLSQWSWWWAAAPIGFYLVVRWFTTAKYRREVKELMENDRRRHES